MTERGLEKLLLSAQCIQHFKFPQNMSPERAGFHLKHWREGFEDITDEQMEKAISKLMLAGVKEFPSIPELRALCPKEKVEEDIPEDEPIWVDKYDGEYDAVYLPNCPDHLVTQFVPLVIIANAKREAAARKARQERAACEAVNVKKAVSNLKFSDDLF